MRKAPFITFKDRSFEQITGVDVSYSVLERAMDRLKLYKLPSMQKDGINIFQSSLTYRDKGFPDMMRLLLK